MLRNYPNLKEGIIEHEGIRYSQPETDDQFLQCVVFGDLLFVNDQIEAWIFSGMIALVLNSEIGVIE